MTTRIDTFPTKRMHIRWRKSVMTSEGVVTSSSAYVTSGAVVRRDVRDAERSSKTERRSPSLRSVPDSALRYAGLFEAGAAGAGDATVPITASFCFGPIVCLAARVALPCAAALAFASADVERVFGAAWEVEVREHRLPHRYHR